MEKKIAELPAFTANQVLIGEKYDTGMAVDEARKEIVLIKNDNGNIVFTTITYKDLLSSEIFVDGDTVTKVARGSQVGGALIGGLVLGGVGAIIGGLSGKTKSSNTVKRVDLRITVNNTKHPLHDINLMDVKGNKDEDMYKLAIGLARHWHGLITVLIKAADEADVQTFVNTSDDGSDNKLLSLADELSKLSKLRDSQVLTEDEFNIQKQKLLSSSYV